MNLKWNQAPVKTQWGHDMVVADVDIDKDHMVSLYCEREQTAKVEAMFAQPASKPWVGLTDEEYSQLHDGFHQQGKLLGWVVDQVEAKLKEKNT